MKRCQVLGPPKQELRWGFKAQVAGRKGQKDSFVVREIELIRRGY